jgi:uncharacterized membrane protein YedE/YeeE
MPVLLSSLLGGVLIGLSAAVLLWANGRPAGISGMVGGSLLPQAGESRGWRLWFLVGLLGAGAVLHAVTPGAFGVPPAVLGLSGLTVAGLLVGVGSQLGNGCTSGHGVCGISRGSVVSLVATGTFMVTGGVAVFFLRHG